MRNVEGQVTQAQRLGDVEELAQRPGLELLNALGQASSLRRQNKDDRPGVGKAPVGPSHGKPAPGDDGQELLKGRWYNFGFVLGAGLFLSGGILGKKKCR